MDPPGVHGSQVGNHWSKPLDAYSDTEFIARYKITRVMFTELLDRLDTFTVRPTSRSHSIPTTTQLAVCILAGHNCFNKIIKVETAPTEY